MDVPFLPQAHKIPEKKSKQKNKYNYIGELQKTNILQIPKTKENQSQSLSNPLGFTFFFKILFI